MIFSSTFEPADDEEPAQCTAFYTNMVSITCNENILSAPLETRTKVSVRLTYRTFLLVENLISLATLVDKIL